MRDAIAGEGEVSASPSPSRPRRVLIGTPTYSGEVTAWYATAYGETVRLCEARGIRIDARFLCYEAFVHSARNELMQWTLEQGYDDLIFIDADQDWMPEWILKLLAYPVDCVGGTVRKKQDIEVYNVRSFVKPVRRCPSTGLLIVDGLGGGFLRLSRHALQLLWDTSEPYTILGRNSRMICETPVIDGRLMGEDTIITVKLAKLGMATYLDPTMCCGHVGTKRWTGDFVKWLAGAEKV